MSTINVYKEYAPSSLSSHLNNQLIVSVLSVTVIVLPLFLTSLVENISRKSENERLLSVANDIVLPNITEQIKTFLRNLTNRSILSNTSRITVFLPVRQGLCRWRITMLTCTSNVRTQEKDLQFRLDEGAVGHALSTTSTIKGSIKLKFYPLSEPNGLPADYVAPQGDNAEIVARYVIGVLVAGIFRDGSARALLAIDVKDQQSMEKLRNPDSENDDEDLHEMAAKLIEFNQDALEFLWRARNNV